MEENQETAQEQKKSNPSLVIGVLVIIAVIAGVFWLTNNKSQPTQSNSMKAENTNVTVTEQPTQSATGSASGQTEAANAITVEGGEFYFKPNEIKVKKGEKVTITLKNVGKMPHNFIVDEFKATTETIRAGAETTVEFTPDKTGTFEFYCSVGSHRKLGMKGNLIVE